MGCERFDTPHGAVIVCSRGRKRRCQTPGCTTVRVPEGASEAMTETIERAALFYDGQIYSLPPPGRHHNIIRLMAADGLPDEAWQLSNQGFVTNTGRFVDRAEAALIARAAGQLIREPTPPNMLTSEDVW